MSKFYSVILLSSREYLVEVEDDQGSGEAVDVVTDNTLFDWADIESSEIKQSYPINEQLFDEVFKLTD